MNVVVFSGGGTRFGIYCGMYAALEDLGYAPDLIIATCGGSIATGIIHSFSTNADRKKYLESGELYRFIKSTRLTAERKLSKIGLLCLRKLLDTRKAPYIEDVFNRYLVEMPEDIAPLLPSLTSVAGKNARSIIVGAKVLFDKSEIGTKRSNRKLYRKVLFTDTDTSRQINIKEMHSPAYRLSAVDPKIEVLTGVPLQTAIRISLSDMFYVPPIGYNGCYFTGGAIDLVPVELARAMGDYVILEQKNRYSPTQEALVRAVLGYSGNERLKEIQGANRWIDTRNATGDVAGHYCRKSVDWLRFRVAISLPETHQQHINNMDVLWNYGYECVKKAIAK